MAQDFEMFVTKVTTASTKTPISDATNSDDMLVGIRCCNIVATSILVDVYVTRSTVDYYVAKNVPIPAGGQFEFIDGGAKFIVLSGDQLNAECDTTNGCDFLVSRIDAIST